jgi:tripartite ATP-independent transporter DctM subunit
MFIVLAILITAGIPVAFSLLFTAIVFGLIVYGWQGVDLVIYAFWNVMNNFTLVAIPLFIFMSALLEKSGVVEDMYKALRDVVGNVRGSLFLIMPLLGYIIGAMSGIAAAGVISLAMIVYPIAKKAYPEAEDMAIGLTVFAGTLPQLIPPSLNMIVYSSMTGVPVSKLFAGGLVMGTILTVAAMIYIALYCVLHKDKVPKLVVDALPIKERIASLLKLLLPLAIILATLGSILSGLATPTEASGVGALATLLYVAMARRLSKSVLK